MAKLRGTTRTKDALIRQLDAHFSLREGVAVSRNDIDVDLSIYRWNRELKGKDELKTVEFVPDSKQTAGPLSWHLSKKDIANLKASWGKTLPGGRKRQRIGTRESRTAGAFWRIFSAPTRR